MCRFYRPPKRWRVVKQQNKELGFKINILYAREQELSLMKCMSLHPLCKTLRVLKVTHKSTGFENKFIIINFLHSA